MSFTVMLVDDHKMVREGFKRILEYNNKAIVVAEASNGKECIQVYNKLKVKPDIILLDINMPEMNGIDTLVYFRKKKIKSHILMLTVHNEVEYLMRAIDIGANGYILKDSDSYELLRAIDFILQGSTFIQPSLIPLLNSRLIARDLENNKLNSLSSREIDVLKLVAAGYMNKDIGTKLNISERTVKNHMFSIFKKLNVEDRTQAAVFAIRNGLIIIS